MDLNGHQAEAIRNALIRLLERPSGAYLIIQEPKTGKFVQFSGSSEEPLYLDLPIQTLSTEEFGTAEKLFKALDLPGPETYQLYEYPGGPPASMQTSFNVTFGRDTKNAMALTVGIFQLVYGVDSFAQLIFTEE
jgi:hypothetical protein